MEGVIPLKKVVQEYIKNHFGKDVRPNMWLLKWNETNFPGGCNPARDRSNHGGSKINCVELWIKISPLDMIV